MASSSQLLSLLALLLAVSSSPSLLAVQAAVQYPGDRLTHICVYMHETVSGQHATMLRSVQSPLGGNSMFGTVNVLDNELRDGPDRWASNLVGRFQGLFVGSGVVSPPGLMTSMNVVFTAGKYNGSTLALLGPVLDFEAPVERSLVGGTGRFRMARGYSVMTSVRNYTTPDSVVLVDKIDLYAKIRYQEITLTPPEKFTRESLFDE